MGIGAGYMPAAAYSHCQLSAAVNCLTLSSAQVTALMHDYLSKFQLAPTFTEDEVEHYLMPVTDVIDSHVVESPSEPPRRPRTYPISVELFLA